MNLQPDLSVVIPVHDAAATIARVVEELVTIPDLDVQVVLVDDHSRDDSAEVMHRLGAVHDGVVNLFHQVNRGAGIARNTGFAAATGRYTMFFDADDIVHGDAVRAAVAALDESGADLAMMPYRYRRGGAVEHEAMNSGDVEIWSAYVGNADQRIVRLDNAARLLGFSNYPWNKVLRTDDYRDAGLRFGSTPVHNDILGHWYSLLFADQIVLLNREVCTHIVEQGGKNLTNQHHRVRLTLFDALDETYDLLEQHPHLRNRFSHHYWSTAVKVATWAQSRIAPELADEFKDRFQRHLMRMSLSDYAHIRLRRDPALADAILRKTLS